MAFFSYATKAKIMNSALREYILTQHYTNI
jgi:hypothetical protein